VKTHGLAGERQWCDAGDSREANVINHGYFHCPCLARSCASDKPPCKPRLPLTNAWSIMHQVSWVPSIRPDLCPGQRPCLFRYRLAHVTISFTHRSFAYRALLKPRLTKSSRANVQPFGSPLRAPANAPSIAFHESGAPALFCESRVGHSAVLR
jgi:hypothetical protein